MAAFNWVQKDDFGLMETTQFFRIHFRGRDKRESHGGTSVPDFLIRCVMRQTNYFEMRFTAQLSLLPFRYLHRCGLIFWFRYIYE